MSEQDFYETSRRSWSQQLENTQPGSFGIPGFATLGKTYEERLTAALTGHLQGFITFPDTFVEIGAGITPFSTYLRGYAYQEPNLEVLLYDSAYHQSVMNRTQALISLLPEIDADEIPYGGGIMKQPLIDETTLLAKVPMRVRISEEGIPNIQIPNDIEKYNLSFVSLANYVAQSDLAALLQDPRIYSITFLNSATAGTEKLSKHFHPDRYTSTLDILATCKRAGFLPMDFIISDKSFDDEGGPEKELASPAIGAILINTAYCTPAVIQENYKVQFVTTRRNFR